MPSFTHEILVDLLRGRPSFAPELVRDVLHAPLPAFERIRVGEATLTQLAPTEYRADLVLVLEGSDGATPAAALVVEVQLTPDKSKRWTWPVYLASLRARLHCGVTLVVVTPNEAIARWAAQPLDLGHPGFSLTPLVLGPATVPIVREEQHALANPELAFLSVLVHGQGPEALAVAKAALVAAASLDEDRATLYADLILNQAPGAVHAALEALMNIPGYEFQSDFFKGRLENARITTTFDGVVTEIVVGKKVPPPK